MQHRQSRFFTVICALLCFALLGSGGCVTTTAMDMRIYNEHVMAPFIGPLSPDLTQRGYMDSLGKVSLQSATLTGSRVGKILYQQLSEDFRLSALLRKDQITRVRTFSDNEKAGDEFVFGQGGFVRQREYERITVQVVATMDWDQDGAPDWIVSCLVRSMFGTSREYLMFVPQPESLDILYGQVIAVRDCKDVRNPERGFVYAGADLAPRLGY